MITPGFSFGIAAMIAGLTTTMSDIVRKVVIPASTSVWRSVPCPSKPKYRANHPAVEVADSLRRGGHRPRVRTYRPYKLVGNRIFRKFVGAVTVGIGPVPPLNRQNIDYIFHAIYSIIYYICNTIIIFYRQQRGAQAGARVPGEPVQDGLFPCSPVRHAAVSVGWLRDGQREANRICPVGSQLSGPTPLQLYLAGGHARISRTPAIPAGSRTRSRRIGRGGRISPQCSARVKVRPRPVRWTFLSSPRRCQSRTARTGSPESLDSRRR